MNISANVDQAALDLILHIEAVLSRSDIPIAQRRAKAQVMIVEVLKAFNK